MIYNEKMLDKPYKKVDFKSYPKKGENLFIVNSSYIARKEKTILTIETGTTTQIVRIIDLNENKFATIIPTVKKSNIKTRGLLEK